MRQCQKCGKTLGQNDDYVYGVIEKRHYDSRQTDVSTDPGYNFYKPYAVIRGGICKDCLKKLSLKSLMISICMIVVSVILIIISLLFTGKRVGEVLSTILGVSGFIGIFVFIAGVYFTIRYIISYSGSGNYTIKKYYKKGIPKENVLYPHLEGDLDVQEAVSGRNSYSYVYVNEKELKKPITGKEAEAAWDTLRKWVKDNDLLS